MLFVHVLYLIRNKGVCLTFVKTKNNKNMSVMPFGNGQHALSKCLLQAVDYVNGWDLQCTLASKCLSNQNFSHNAIAIFFKCLQL